MQLNDECLEKWKVSSKWISTAGLVDEIDRGIGWKIELNNYFKSGIKIIGTERECKIRPRGERERQVNSL